MTIADGVGERVGAVEIWIGSVGKRTVGRYRNRPIGGIGVIDNGEVVFGVWIGVVGEEISRDLMILINLKRVRLRFGRIVGADNRDGQRFRVGIAGLIGACIGECLRRRFTFVEIGVGSIGMERELTVSFKCNRSSPCHNNGNADRERLPIDLGDVDRPVCRVRIVIIDKDGNRDRSALGGCCRVGCMHNRIIDSVQVYRDHRRGPASMTVGDGVAEVIVRRFSLIQRFGVGIGQVVYGSISKKRDDRPAREGDRHSSGNRAAFDLHDPDLIAIRVAVVRLNDEIVALACGHFVDVVTSQGGRVHRRNWRGQRSRGRERPGTHRRGRDWIAQWGFLE